MYPSIILTAGRPLGLAGRRGRRTACRPAHPVRRETRARTFVRARELPEPPEETLWEVERKKEQGKSNNCGLLSHSLFNMPAL